MTKLFNNLLRPSYKTGFAAPGRGLSYRYPSLWRNCVGAWCPSLGRSGNTLFDHSGYKLRGTLTGMTLSTQWSPHRLEFDGDDDFVDIDLSSTNSPAMMTGTKLSWSMWFEWNSGDSFQRLIDRSSGGNGTGGYAIHIESGTVRMVRNGAGTTYNSDASFVTGGEWYHLVLTFDGANYSFYRNGSPWGSPASTLGPGTAALTMRFGSWNHSTGRELNGAMDDIRFYKRVLTFNEIQLLASRPRVAYEYYYPNAFKTSGAPAPVVQKKTSSSFLLNYSRL